MAMVYSLLYDYCDKKVIKMTSKQLKSKQRKQGIAARKSIPAELANSYNQSISGKLLSLEVYKKACTILSYQSFGGEVDLTLFNQSAARDGKKVAFPISESGMILIAAIPLGENSWELGKFGIRAPVKEESQLLAPEEIDLVLVPCTAFSTQKLMRIGMGAGYYDRFLPKCQNAKSIAVAFEAQKIDDIWTDSWDVPLDGIVTESGIWGSLKQSHQPS